MKVVEFPTSGLTQRDCEALESEAVRRRGQGLPGHIMQGVAKSGGRWAALTSHPGGPPLQHFSRDKGVYYLLDFSDGGSGRLVDAARDFKAILKHLAKKPRGH